MGLTRGIPRAALVVPDEETYLAFADAAPDWEATEEPGRAELLVVPERIPEGLAPAVRRAWSLAGVRDEVRTYASPQSGTPAADVLDAGAEEQDEQDEHNDGGHDHGGHDHGGHDHGGHDHGDMMAITGEPSADGLVMESMDTQAGPLGVALPGGLVVRAELDGDVVAACEVTATLRAGPAALSPDPWSAAAWSAAALAAAERGAGVAAPRDRRLLLAAVEIERAVSHAAWLHRFCRLLGWPHMTERVRAVLRAAVAARGALPVASAAPDLPYPSAGDLRAELLHAARLGSELADLLTTSRVFARRTSGLGALDAGEVRSRGLTGPVARAAGVPEDERAGDPGYEALGFEPVVEADGDARARTLVRAAEIAGSLRLAAEALARLEGAIDAEPPAFGAAPTGRAESARGPVGVLHAPGADSQRTAPGARAAQQTAGELAVGREWAAALVTIASFDLSPWRVGP